MVSSYSLLGGLLLVLLASSVLSAPISTAPESSLPSPTPSPLPTTTATTPRQVQPEFCEEYLELQLSQLQRRGSDSPSALHLGDILVSVRKEGEREKRAAIHTDSVQGVRWPNATIPYTFSKIREIYRNTFISAMDLWERSTCIKFVERTTEEDYVEMTEALNCASYIGHRGGKQEVSIGPNCGAVGNALHELGHVIGFAHEHSRPDRDDYVTVLWDNVDQSFRANFCKFKATDINSFGVGYDYESVMHYGSMAFSVNGHPTIEPRNPSVTIGQRRNISHKDAVQVNKMYGCPALGDVVTPSPNASEATTSTSMPTPTPTTPRPMDNFLSSGDYVALRLVTGRTYVVCLGGEIGCVPIACATPGRCGNDEFQLLKDPTSKDRFIRVGDRVALGTERRRVQCSATQCKEVRCSRSYSGMFYQAEACRGYTYRLWSPDRRRGEIIQSGDGIFIQKESERTTVMYCSKKKCQMKRLCGWKNSCNPIARFTAIKIQL